MGEPVFVVFNPRSGKGRGARLVQPVLAALARPGVTVEQLLAAPKQESTLCATTL